MWLVTVIILRLGGDTSTPVKITMFNLLIATETMYTFLQERRIKYALNIVITTKISVLTTLNNRKSPSTNVLFFNILVANIFRILKV